jgi:hypothetical protein
MTTKDNPKPTEYKGVMVSSTFTDLIQHRAALIRAIDGQELKSVVMENDSAKPAVDVLDSSLEMVHKASAYIGVISHKYGQIPDDPKRNPDRLSLTELEYNEARRLNRPILIFIMGDQHDVKIADIERDPEKIKKLEDFRENAKRIRLDSSIHRVYKVFNNIQEFEVAATQSVAELRRFLDQETPLHQVEVLDKEPPEINSIPDPPAVYAEPPYIGSHQFLGRAAQLDTLNDWASAADPHPILLFEAIGGAGKSILTWEWINKYAASIRGDWAGVCWYSFYEKGAVIADFCRHALAYMTKRQPRDFQKKRTVELGEILLYQLKQKPWLMVLDGLERILVAYNRFDAAQLADENAGSTDEIARRDPCAAIRFEDDDLLRMLSSAAPSKILITSRLIPRVLINSASQPIPGVVHEHLPGLRPIDAEMLFKSCGVTGNSRDVQDYLQKHCDCHPLVIGVLAGIVNSYLPARGNFDIWVTDDRGGGQLNLANLDLIQKRNHILRTAFTALNEKDRQLLSILALMSEAADYPTLSALNPHLPLMPNEVEKPLDPKKVGRPLSDDDMQEAQRKYQIQLDRWNQYQDALRIRLESQEYLAAPRKLQETVINLERRGLMQYDPLTKRYDLHPVVRGIAAGRLHKEEKEHYGQIVADYFSQKVHNPYKEAQNTEDLGDGLQVVRALLQIGRYQDAYSYYIGDLSSALSDLEAHAEKLALIRPFYPQGWDQPSVLLDDDENALLAFEVASSLRVLDEHMTAIEIYGISLSIRIKQKHWDFACARLSGIAMALRQENRLAKSEYCRVLAYNLASLTSDKETLVNSMIDQFVLLSDMGRWADAEAMWQEMQLLKDSFSSDQRDAYAYYQYAWFLLKKGDLAEEHLDIAEQKARKKQSRFLIRSIHQLRGEWYLQQDQVSLASDSLHESVRMAREAGITNEEAETLLALVRIQLGQLSSPRLEAERLAGLRDPCHRFLAELWLVIGDQEMAKIHAQAAYIAAWADGEPYVARYELDKTYELLTKLGAEVPVLPPYDPAKEIKFAWEEELSAAMKELQAESDANKAAKENREENRNRG